MIAAFLDTSLAGGRPLDFERAARPRGGGRGRGEPERALDILAAEAARGALDSELLRIFVEAEVYRVIDDSGSS